MIAAPLRVELAAILRQRSVDFDTSWCIPSIVLIGAPGNGVTPSITYVVMEREGNGSMMRWSGEIAMVSARKSTVASSVVG